ncbi:MAG: hypothetical protein FRX49_01132 [Trebouxia sp. A1-2]|nr:MAG: hypothetical protein FRX49_01132 [Trebouxia sp. A1-2]
MKAMASRLQSPGLKERFGIEDTAIILFRDRQMYKYANPIQKGANSKGVLQQFALKGYEYLEALPVPQPQSFWAAAMKELFSTQLLSRGRAQGCHAEGISMRPGQGCKTSGCCHPGA